MHLSCICHSVFFLFSQFLLQSDCCEKSELEEKPVCGRYTLLIAPDISVRGDDEEKKRKKRILQEDSSSRRCHLFSRGGWNQRRLYFGFENFLRFFGFWLLWLLGTLTFGAKIGILKSKCRFTGWIYGVDLRGNNFVRKTPSISTARFLQLRSTETEENSVRH